MPYTLAGKDAGIDCPHVAEGETEAEVLQNGLPFDLAGGADSRRATGWDSLYYIEGNRRLCLSLNSPAYSVRQVLSPFVLLSL